MPDKKTQAFLEQCAQKHESAQSDPAALQTNDFVAPVLTEVDIEQITSGGADVSTTAAAVGLGLSAIV